MILTNLNISEQEISNINIITADQGKTPQKKRDDIAAVLGSNAFRIADAKWEAIMTIASMAAKNVVDSIAASNTANSNNFAGLDSDVIQPLKAFIDSYDADKSKWMQGESHDVSNVQNAGFLQSLTLLIENHDLRISMIAEYNAKVQKTAVIGGIEVVVMTSKSEFSKQKLCPLSKRDLLAQLIRVNEFAQSTPEGFTIH